jgi:hypothetical protein
VTKLLNHLKHNVVAYLALFVALGGTSYAAVNLPAGSVGTKQLRNGAVTNTKLAKGSVGAGNLDRKTIGGYIRAYAEVAGNGQIYAASPSATTVGWQAGGPKPGGTIKWSRRMPKTCFALATVDSLDSASATAILVGGSRANAQTYVTLSDPGQAVNVAVVCAEP